MGKNTVIKYVMGFESWEGEYTAVQLINNNGLTRVLTGCFLCVHPRCDLAAISRWKSCSSQKDAVNRTGSFLSADVPLPHAKCKVPVHDLKSQCAALCVEEGGCKMQMLVLTA